MQLCTSASDLQETQISATIIGASLLSITGKILARIVAGSGLTSTTLTSYQRANVASERVEDLGEVSRAASRPLHGAY